MKKLQIKTLANRVGGRDVQNPDPGTGGDTGGPCRIGGCNQTLNPFGGYYECCCYYHCPSGTQMVCRTDYCSR